MLAEKKHLSCADAFTNLLMHEMNMKIQCLGFGAQYIVCVCVYYVLQCHVGIGECEKQHNMDTNAGEEGWRELEQSANLYQLVRIVNIPQRLKTIKQMDIRIHAFVHN